RYGGAAFGLGHRVRGESRFLPPLVQRLDERRLGPSDLAVLDVLDELMDQPSDPGLVPAAGVQAELVAQDELELAVLQTIQAREREGEVLLRRSILGRPLPLEPPAAGVLAEGEDPGNGREPIRRFERGRAAG